MDASLSIGSKIISYIIILSKLSLVAYYHKILTDFLICSLALCKCPKCSTRREDVKLFLCFLNVSVNQKWDFIKINKWNK